MDCELGNRKQTFKAKEMADIHTPGKEREDDLFRDQESRMAGVSV